MLIKTACQSDQAGKCERENVLAEFKREKVRSSLPSVILFHHNRVQILVSIFHM